MATEDETTKAELADTDLDAAQAGSSQPSSNGGFSDISGLGAEVTIAEHRSGGSRWNVFTADLFNEPHATNTDASKKSLKD
ncbi:MAG: hypothetical protein AAGC81_00275 [Pseudomonadota bacterium]